MITTKMENVARGYIKAPEILFSKYPLVVSYFICPSSLVENKMLLVFTENTKSYSDLDYLPL